VLAVVALVVLMVGGGFAYWRGSRFPARSEYLPGTPIELRIQDGVQPRELRMIRSGLRSAQRYMESRLGRTVHGHVEARIARSNGCRPFQSPGGSLVGEADRGFLCIDTANLHWKWLVLKDRLAATSTAAHEYVHVLQAELGCLSKGSESRYRWILEGMAEYVAWRALVADGKVGAARVAREIRESGPLSPWLGPLSAYEHEGGRDQAYALWHLAIQHVLREAVAAGAAPAARREIALRRFCQRAGAGVPWRTAFERSFGFPVDKFYARFDAARRNGTLLPAR
jgi:hypothetical protein